MHSKITFVCVPLDKFQVLHGCIVILFTWKAHDPKMQFKAKWNPCYEYQIPGIYWHSERGPLHYYSRNMKRTSRPFHSLRPQRKMSENTIYCSTQTAASERRKAVGFLELLMHVICIQLNVKSNWIQFYSLRGDIYLGSVTGNLQHQVTRDEGIKSNKHNLRRILRSLLL